MQSMHAVVKHSRNGEPYFIIEEVPVPAITSPDEVKIKIAYAGICTSDIHVLSKAMKMPDGNIVGHEYSGVVSEVGNGVEALRVGDRVVCELAVGYCGNCKMCRRGKYELCPSKRPPGWVSQGIYTEYAVMRSRIVHRLPDSIPLDVAALAEPIAICVYGCLERARIQKEDLTLIYGMGPIGLLSLIVLRDFGVEKIVCVSPTKHGRERLTLAKELGADLVIATEDFVPRTLFEQTGEKGVDCVVECSGAEPAINEGIRLLNRDGKFVGLGIAHHDSVNIAYNTALLNPLTLTYSCTSSHTSWITTLGIMERNQSLLQRLITHRFPLAEWEKAYRAIETRQAIKCLLVP